MAENSGIAWTTNTFNPWVGCTKVGPGCDHCYAETWNARFGDGIAPNWGPGAPRRRTTVQNWNNPLKWQRERAAAIARGESPEHVRVFCASLADVFDNEVDSKWRQDLFDLIGKCPDLEWQIVTKRVGNVTKMAPDGGFPTNVILISTIVDQEEADRDLWKLLSIKGRGLVSKIGVSYEPALGPINWRRVRVPTGWQDVLFGYRNVAETYDGIEEIIDWIIIGGESDQCAANARPFRFEWARSTISQCARAGVAVFTKQVGSRPIPTIDLRQYPDDLTFIRDRAGADPLEWPADLRVREFPKLTA